MLRDGGTFYICNKTLDHCRFVRWCSTKSQYVPSANFATCVHLNKPNMVEEFNSESLKEESVEPTIIELKTKKKSKKQV